MPEKDVETWEDLEAEYKREDCPPLGD